MIWVAGELVPDDALKVSVLDRTFEHGLGLFETFRTWNSWPTLLPKHFERMAQSARALGLPFDETAWPSPIDVARLLEADGFSGDAVLRVTLSGGLDDQTPGTLWMKARSLPPPMPEPEAKVRSTWIIREDDPLARFKTLNYWARRLVFQQAQAAGFDEDIGRSPDGFVFEGSRTNLFMVEDEQLITPALNVGTGPAPILPGIMRSVGLEQAKRLGLYVFEEPRLTLDRLMTADEVFLTNGGRGIIPVAQFGPQPEQPETKARHYEAPGPITKRLQADLETKLRSGELP